MSGGQVEGQVDVPGVRRIPVETPSGTFEVWTRRAGAHPTVKVLLLHGGPGATHEYLLDFESAGRRRHRVLLLRPAGLALQRPAGRPVAVGDRAFRRRGRAGPQRARARPDNFVLYGQSWGGVLAIEYALAHPRGSQGPSDLEHDGQHPGVQPLRRGGADAARWTRPRWPRSSGSRPRADRDPRYEELLMEHHYVHHVLPLPAEEWPDRWSAASTRSTKTIYVPMQGPSELGASGTLVDWDRAADLARSTCRPCDRRGARHQGPRAPALDGRAAAARALPHQPRGQPPRHGRRPGPVRRRRLAGRAPHE